MPAAEASMCVAEQGADKFWKWADTVFAHQQAMEDADLAKYAKDAGANVDKYKECVSAHKYADAVQKDMKYGESLGVKSTPTFFINGELVAGAVPIENFEEIINDALADAKK
jgi:protein-disulfide isomerase